MQEGSSIANYPNAPSGKRENIMGSRLPGILMSHAIEGAHVRRACRNVDPELVAAGPRELEDSELGMLARPAAQRPHERLAAMVRPEPAEMTLQQFDVGGAHQRTPSRPTPSLHRPACA